MKRKKNAKQWIEHETTQMLNAIIGKNSDGNGGREKKEWIEAFNCVLKNSLNQYASSVLNALDEHNCT